MRIIKATLRTFVALVIGLGLSHASANAHKIGDNLPTIKSPDSIGTGKLPKTPSNSTQQGLTLNPSQVAPRAHFPQDKLAQFQRRGWTTQEIEELVSGRAVHTSPAVNRANDGAQSTAFFRADGHHVVQENMSGLVFQASDTRLRVARIRTDQNEMTHWVPDRSIRNPYFPPGS